MIKKLRHKIIGFFMGFAAVVLAATMLIVCFTVARNTAKVNETQLKQVLHEYGPNTTTPFDDYAISFSYFTVEVFPSGTAYVNGNSSTGYNEEQILAIIKATVSTHKTSGILKDESLRFYMETSTISTKIAYMSCQTEIASLQKICTVCIISYFGSLLILFGISCLLSKIATNPVDSAWKQQKQFLSDASHELKTPLTVILSSADLLKEVSDKQSEGYVDNIRAEGIRMKHLVEDMLTLSRMENAPNSTFVSVDFSDIVTDTVLRFEPVSYENGHELISTIENDLHLDGNPTQLQQLCGILLDNALKYAAPASPITLSLKREGKLLLLDVSNPCPPIPEEKLSHLFDRFYRGDDSRGIVEGYGLGLAIAKNIVDAHHGKIFCTSEQITTFHVMLSVS